MVCGLIGQTKRDWILGAGRESQAVMGNLPPIIETLLAKATLASRPALNLRSTHTHTHTHTHSREMCLSWLSIDQSRPGRRRHLAVSASSKPRCAEEERR